MKQNQPPGFLGTVGIRRRGEGSEKCLGFHVSSGVRLPEFWFSAARTLCLEQVRKKLFLRPQFPLLWTGDDASICIVALKTAWSRAGDMPWDTPPTASGRYMVVTVPRQGNSVCVYLFTERQYCSAVKSVGSRAGPSSALWQLGGSPLWACFFLH